MGFYSKCTERQKVCHIKYQMFVCRIKYQMFVCRIKYQMLAHHLLAARPEREKDGILLRIRRKTKRVT